MYVSDFVTIQTTTKVSQSMCLHSILSVYVYINQGIIKLFHSCTMSNNGRIPSTKQVKNP